jgi:hypothetical protein
MTKLLIEISDAKDARLLIDFARRLNANVLQMEADNDEVLFWEAVSLGSLEKAYGDDEPDYDHTEVMEPNPEYKP